VENQPNYTLTNNQFITRRPKTSLAIAPFTENEVSEATKGMKSNSGPGPNRFTVTFFKHLWDKIKNEIMKLVHDFNGAKLDLKRLNYGVIM
jgi:hypothetical protein